MSQQQSAVTSIRSSSQTTNASTASIQKSQSETVVKKSPSAGTSPSSTSTRYPHQPSQPQQQQQTQQRYIVPRANTALAVVRLIQLQEAISGADSSSPIEYWRSITHEFFQPNVLFWVSVGQQRFCIPFNAVGRFFHCFFQDGVDKMRVLLENPHQYTTMSSSALIDVTKVHLTMHYFDDTDIHISSAIRALVAPSMKIEWIQLDLLNHTEMIPRSVAEMPKSLPKDRFIGMYGLSTGVITFLELADIFFHMQEVIAAVQSSSSTNPGGIVGTFRMLVDPMQTQKRPISPGPSTSRRNSATTSPRLATNLKKIRVKNESHHVSPKLHKK